MPRTRTFIAIELDQPIRDRLVKLQETLGRADCEVKWVGPENLHVTLLFLGEVDNRELADVCRVVSATCAELPAFPLSVETVGCFGNPRRPRTIWAGVGTGSEEVIALHAALEPPLLDLGCYRKEERRYTPHITLGRVKSDLPADRLAVAMNRQAKWHGGECTVSQLHIMSSELTRDGPLYTVLGRGKLGKPKPERGA